MSIELPSLPFSRLYGPAPTVWQRYFTNLGAFGPSSALSFAAFSILMMVRGLPVLPSTTVTVPERPRAS